MKSAIGALASSLVVTIGCRSGPEPARPLNVVIVTADTLRADRLPIYGYEKVETPNLDRMAAEGVVFENAHTVVPLTLPAHSSMFTGTFPMYHGVRDNGGYYLDDAQVTLAETLKASGYATGGFVAAFVLDARWGLNQGFDRYFDEFDLNKFEKIGLDTVQRPGGEVVDEALLWMDGVKEQPFFSWIHLYDVHTPWEPPEPFLSRYRAAPYDGEIAYVDSLMGRLFDWIEQSGLTDDTVVVFIGDHGESLGQHAENTHGYFIYDATMHVPFVIKTPYRQVGRGRRVAAQVRSVDLMPTLLELVGLPVPETVQGESLVSLLTGESEDLGLLAYGESFYPRNHYGWSELKSIRDGSYHFIDAPRPELFDVASDPGQRTNLAPQRAATVAKLKSALDDLVDRFGVEGIDEKGPETLDPEAQAQLAALGYIGGPSRVSIDPDRPLADPKDKIGLFNLIKQAGSDSSEGNTEEALEKIDRVLAEDPDILEAHNIRGNLFSKQGDLENALIAFQEALARDPEYKPALYSLALTYKELGRAKDAEAGFRRIIDLDARDNRAYFMLAQIHAEREEFDEALALLQKAVDLGSERAPLHNLMAECYIGLKELDRAKEEVDRALEMNPQLATAHYNLALIHEERGEIDAAIAAYEKEIEVAPKDFKAHFNLAKLYGGTGRPQKMKAHFEKAIEVNDKFAIGHLYLAKVHLDAGDLDQAQQHATKGIELGPEPKMAPFGHFILADVYNRQGRFDDAQRELETAQRLSAGS
ncbi:MAG TPA: sulfatase-like hydrolase/transferase [Vicinamibacteria bacterium]|nr:sulfatase-like hydrolase/transferase [Vicinamibacteria bacterium]